MSLFQELTHGGLEHLFTEHWVEGRDSHSMCDLLFQPPANSSFSDRSFWIHDGIEGTDKWLQNGCEHV